MLGNKFHYLIYSRHIHTHTHTHTHTHIFVSFRRAVKKTAVPESSAHDAKPRTSLKTFTKRIYTLELDLGPFPSFPPE